MELMTLFHRLRTRITYRSGMLLLFMTLLASVSGYASTFSLYTDTVYTFTGKVLFPKASAVVSPDFSDNSRHIDSIRSFLSSSDTGNLLSVKVIGSYSPEGKYAFNTKLAKARALAMADIVKGFNPALTPAISIKHPHGNYDYSRQRFAELQIVCRSKTENTTSQTLFRRQRKIRPYLKAVQKAQRSNLPPKIIRLR